MSQFSNGTGTCAANPCCNAFSCHSRGDGIAGKGGSGAGFEQKSKKGQPHRRRANLGFRRSTSVPFPLPQQELLPLSVKIIHFHEHSVESLEVGKKHFTFFIFTFSLLDSKLQYLSLFFVTQDFD